MLSLPFLDSLALFFPPVGAELGSSLGFPFVKKLANVVGNFVSFFGEALVTNAETTKVTVI